MAGAQLGDMRKVGRRACGVVKADLLPPALVIGQAQVHAHAQFGADVQQVGDLHVGQHPAVRLGIAQQAAPLHEQLAAAQRLGGGQALAPLVARHLQMAAPRLQETARHGRRGRATDQRGTGGGHAGAEEFASGQMHVGDGRKAA
ncbi:hypothetical protein GY15_12165 [Delftia sp. 670]|nr:hypothetical protein GY15_12165 [Delftia sp. 670]